MWRRTFSIGGVILCGLVLNAFGQGRGGPEWTTTNGNAQRTGSQKTDPKIHVDTVTKSFQFLWKLNTENSAKGANSLSAPALMNSVIGWKGFRALEFVAGSSDTVVGVDSDLGRFEWKTHLTAAAGPAPTATCPGGLSPSVSRLTPLVPPVQPVAGGGGGGRGASGRGPGGGGGGGRGPGPGTVPEANRVYVVASDGTARTLNVQTGGEVDPAIKFLSPGAKVSGLIAINGTLYGATADSCGGNANGIYSLDLASKAVNSWKTGGGSVAGTAGAAFSTNGMMYAATTDGQLAALDVKTLQVKDSFTASNKSGFNSSPTLFKVGSQELVAVSSSDGMIYVFDAANLKSALSTTTKYVNTAASATAGAVTTFDAAAGTQWVYAAAVGPQSTDTKFATSYGAVTNGAIVAFRVAELVGKPSLQPVWISRDMATPLAPVVVNGILFALASGAQTNKSAVLYALDAATGKELWNSGSTITSHASANAGIAVAASQLYFGTADGTIWTFGYYMEH